MNNSENKSNKKEQEGMKNVARSFNVKLAMQIFLCITICLLISLVITQSGEEMLEENKKVVKDSPKVVEKPYSGYLTSVGYFMQDVNTPVKCSFNLNGEEKEIELNYGGSIPYTTIDYDSASSLIGVSANDLASAINSLNDYCVTLDGGVKAFGVVLKDVTLDGVHYKALPMYIIDSEPNVVGFNICNKYMIKNEEEKDNSKIFSVFYIDADVDSKKINFNLNKYFGIDELSAYIKANNYSVSGNGYTVSDNKIQ